MKTTSSTNLPQTFRNTVVAPIKCEENSSLMDSFETPATGLPIVFPVTQNGWDVQIQIDNLFPQL
jgi:hypothetical protein